MNVRVDIGGARLAVPLVACATLLLLRPTPLLAVCQGDCNRDGRVTVDELVTAIDVAVSQSSPDICPLADANQSGSITVDELVLATRNALHGCTIDPTATHTPPEPSPTATATPTTDPDAPIPTSADELLAWLRAGSYLSWAAESGPHRSAGPHFTTVRAFVNPTALASLAAGNTAHPAGTALVKELYGTSTQVQGWSVIVKLQDDSAAGDGWYWYERFRDTTYAAATGAPGCTGCHSLGRDFVLSPYPLQ